MMIPMPFTFALAHKSSCSSRSLFLSVTFKHWSEFLKSLSSPLLCLFPNSGLKTCGYREEDLEGNHNQHYVYLVPLIKTNCYPDLFGASSFKQIFFIVSCPLPPVSLWQWVRCPNDWSLTQQWHTPSSASVSCSALSRQECSPVSLVIAR